MNVIGILRKYTKQSILNEIKTLFQPDDYTLFKYERLIDMILKKADKTKEKIDSKYTICFEMQFDTDNNDFRLYALENEVENGQEVDVTSLSVSDTIFAEIDKELETFMEEKTIIARLLNEILNYIYEDSNTNIIKVNLNDIIGENNFPFGSIFDDILSMINNFENTIKGNLKTTNIGDFNVESGKIILADPGEFEIEDNPNIIDVKKGLWTSEIASSAINSKENFSLILKHDDYRDKDYNCISIDEDAEDSPNYIKIKNNMLSAVELNSFRNDNLLDKDYIPSNNFGLPFKDNESNELKRERWYGKCCDVTLENELGAGLITNGVVSSVRYKDSNLEYTLFRSEDDEIIAIRIYLLDYEKSIDEIKEDLFDE